MTVLQPPGQGDLASQLGVSMEVVTRRIRFLRGYADWTLGELEEGAGDGEGFDLRVDAASSLREGAQLSLLVDHDLTAELMGRSGLLFQDLGSALGPLLLTFAGSDEARDSISYGLYASLLEGALPHPITARQEGGVEPPSPQQQIYLMLAGVRSTRLGAEFAQSLDELVSQSPHRSGVVPVGALGTPLMEYWAIVDHLMHPDSSSSLAVIVNQLMRMCRRHAEAMRMAQVNNYLWRNLASR